MPKTPVIALVGLALMLSSGMPLPSMGQQNGASSFVARPDIDAVWLRQAPWNEDERALYYHLSSGTQLIPYSWFLALEQPDKEGLFTDDDHMKQLHLIPDGAHPVHNPDGLPLGFTKTVFPNDPRGIKEYVGITCAFCHTGELHITSQDRGRLTLYIEGGGSMQNNPKFLEALVTSLARTASDEAKLKKFAKPVLKQWDNEESRKALKKALNNSKDVLVARSHREEVQEWGVGRFDALNRGSNLVFMPLHSKNESALDAPVSIPPLWNVHLYDWVQWNGAIQNPLARNIAQVIGIGSGLFQNPPFQDLQDPKALLLLKRPPDPFASSLEIDKLLQLEEMVSTIKPPRWPEELFGEINMAKAVEGKQLYRDNCKHCHVPALLDSPTGFGQRFKMNIIDPAEVGTDTKYLNFVSRRVQTGKLKDDFGAESLSAAKASEWLTTTLMRRWTPDPGPNKWESYGLLARPHAGVWATPPFLHNGSVPNLYEILSPMEERTACFYLGDLEYDTEKAGYKVRPCADGERHGEFKFDTSKDGNRQTGHEFRRDNRAGQIFTPEECKSFEKGGKNGILGCELNRDQRMAIIEYLKTCDLDDVTWNPHEIPKVCKARRVFLPE
ncbi:di-heme-cytochrome C peroxidase [Nitrospira sp. Nam80]